MRNTKSGPLHKKPLDCTKANRHMIAELDRRITFMRLALIVLSLLATTGIVYAACVFC